MGDPCSSWRRTSYFLVWDSGPPSPVRRLWTVLDLNLGVLLPDLSLWWSTSNEAERHGKNLEANIYRNLKMCLLSLPALLPSPSPNAERLKISVYTHTYTHLMWSCLLFLMTYLWNAIGSNCFHACLRKGWYHLAFLFLIKVEMGWDKSCSIEKKFQYKYACNSLQVFHI